MRQLGKSKRRGCPKCEGVDGVEVDNYLNRTIAPEIEKAAKAGKRSVFIIVGSEPPYGSTKALKEHLHTSTMMELTQLGYKARWVTEDSLTIMAKALRTSTLAFTLIVVG